MTKGLANLPRRIIAHRESKRKLDLWEGSKFRCTFLRLKRTKKNKSKQLQRREKVKKAFLFLKSTIVLEVVVRRII